MAAGTITYLAPEFFAADSGLFYARMENSTTLRSVSPNSATLTVPGGTWASTFRVGISWSLTSFTLAANGLTGTSAQAFTPTPTNLWINNSSGATLYTGNNHVRSLAAYNTALPAAALATRATVGAGY